MLTIETMTAKTSDIYYDILFHEYQKNTPYHREYKEQILESFSKKDLKQFISDTKGSLTFLKKYYERDLFRVKKKIWQLEELSEYFVNQMFYTFEGWYELDESEKFLNILEFYYRRNHKKYSPTALWKYKKFIDVNDIPIDQVIGKYMRFKRGLHMNQLCPIHREKTPSMRIYKNSNSYFCYWCHSGGNAINFIADIENTSTKEAWKKFQDYFNI